MNTDLDNLYEKWTAATGNLPWGTQHAFHTVLKAAQDGETTLVYGADYGLNGACLVNTVGVMLTTGGGHGVPSANFGEVVSLFDQINSALYMANCNDKAGIVSPLSADILLTHYAPLKEQPDFGPIAEDELDATYKEPTDAAMAEALAELFTNTPAAATITFDPEHVDRHEVVVHAARNDTTFED